MVLGCYPGVVLRCLLLRVTDVELVSEKFHVFLNFAHTMWALMMFFYRVLVMFFWTGSLTSFCEG